MFAMTFREQSDLPNVLGHIGVSERPKDVGHLILARINSHVADVFSEIAVCTIPKQDCCFPKVQEVDVSVNLRSYGFYHLNREIKRETLESLRTML
jgi:hypothetical protein